MSYAQKGNKNESEVTEALMGGIGFIAKLLMWAGLLSSLVSFGFLLFYVILFSSGSTNTAAANVHDLIETFRKVLTGGLLSFFIGSAYLFWGEGWIEVVQLLVSVLFFLAPTL